MTILDLHCHILPGVDDGSKDLLTSLNLAKAAVDQGISHLLLTPHHLDGKYLNHKVDVIQKVANFQTKLNKSNIPLKVFPSQEVHLNGELIKYIEDDDLLFMDETNRYLLLELPHDDIPKYTANIIFELQSKGIIPVIAHPERNLAFQKDPEKLYKLVQMGCLTQLTSGSYLGIFGRNVQQFTEKIIKSNLGFTFASDAHNFSGRQFLMEAALERLTREEGTRTAMNFKTNAKNIINGDDVDESVIKHISSLTKSKKKFWLFKN